MSIYDEKPWLAQYPEGQPAEIEVEHETALDMLRATIAKHPQKDAIRYLGSAITFQELDEMADAFAAALAGRGVGKGDRVAAYLQNVPQFVITQAAVWKLGAIVVNINPMYREKELHELLTDSGAKVLVCLETLYDQVGRNVVPETEVQHVVVTSELEYQTTNDERVLGGIERLDLDGVEQMSALIEENRGATPDPVDLTGGDLAVFTYTSGTTGPAKGAMTTHRNIAFNSQTYRDWVQLSAEDIILGVAPMFHITGLIGHVGVAMLTGATLVLTYRMEPSHTLETIEREKVTFTIGSITVYIALMNSPAARREQLATCTKIFSGGAPIPPSTVRAFQDTFGQYIHNMYGLTETTSPSHGVPLWADAPVDEQSGALSVGVPVYSTIVRVIGEDGAELPAGEVGELVTEGPQIVAGYWNKPEATAKGIPNGALHTGDVGYMDADGWFYLIDRKKDQINVGGYKVWPREVEDVLYEHEAVREAAVVGVADPYRGETVKAFVSLRPGAEATEDELIAFCKKRMAAYKYPRLVEILDEIPKTATGKLLRRDLRGR